MACLLIRYCFAGIRSIPVIFIVSVIVWSYYAYVIQMCIFTVPNIIEKLFYIFCYHPLLFMMSWSYWRTIFTSVAVPSKQFYLSRPDLDRLQGESDIDIRREFLKQIGKTLPVQCRGVNGEVRYCDKCKCVKPDRAHHCSVCGRCVLKMDHHCPWVNNCVCFSNYKFFVLFLGYSLVYCIFVSMTSLQYFIKFWTEIGEGKSDISNLHIVFLFFAGIMFSISLLSLFCYHCFLISKNRSTLESFHSPIFISGPDKNAFNLGTYANFQEVFGDNRLYWFLPFNTSFGDGVIYPVRTVNEYYNRLLGEREHSADEDDIENGIAGFVNETSVRVQS